MFYKLIKTPPVIKTGNNILNKLNEILLDFHLFFPEKILITQKYLYKLYENNLISCGFSKIVYIEGGSVGEYNYIKEHCNKRDSLLVAFGGGSVIDIVKYTANKMDIPYITIPSTLSNDGIYSSVARLVYNGKKTSYGVQPPIGIIVDFEIIKKSPKKLILAGVADLMSNLSALQDWLLAYHNIKEPINELAFILAKQAAMPLLNDFDETDILSDKFLFELTNGLIISGLSMIISGDTRGTSGSEHLISHAIDEYFPEKSTIHGIQVGWAHLLIEKKFRNSSDYTRLNNFYNKIGLTHLFEELIPWKENDLEILIPYARKIRDRYTIFNTI